jgi:predicted negative regulator of RcsB-dependent stress response
MAKTKNKAQETSAQKPESKGADMIENPEFLLDKTEDFFQKNKTLIIAALAAVVIIVGGFVGYRYLADSQQQAALTELYPAEYYFQIDSLNKMLNGDGNNLGVLEIAENYSWSKASETAHLYAGIGFMKQGKFEEALKHLSKYKANDAIIQGRAFALQGDAHMELKQPQEAIKFYKKAAEHYPNKFFTPTYLMKLALAYEEAKDTASAISTYDKVITTYFDTQEVNNAKKYKARLEAEK